MRYRNIEEAQSEVIEYKYELNLMLLRLSGCDWCCGGGDEKRNALRTRITEASEWLESRGAEVPITRELCEACEYNPASVHVDDEGWWALFVCTKCADHRRRVQHEDVAVEGDR